MCTFDGAAFLREQLQSIADQVRLPDELIVCDDGSSDDTVAIVREFAARAPFPVVIRQNEERLGPAANFDQGFGLAQHGYVACCDQDDVWRPERLERQASALDRHPDAWMCFSDGAIIGVDSNPTGGRIWERVNFSSTREFWSADELFAVLIGRTAVTGATLMVRREVLDDLRPVPAGWLHDEWLALTGSAVGHGAVALTEPLIGYRMHDDQHTGLRVRTLDLDAIRTGRRPISDEAARSRELVARLRGRSGVTSERLGAIEARHRHLEARERAANSDPVRRANKVLVQLARGRYHRYSNGWTSAVADLVGRTSDAPGSSAGSSPSN